MIELEAFEPIGARVSGLALSDVDDAAVGDVERLLAEHGVLIVTGQQLDDAAFVAFLSRFGRLVFTAGETPVDGVPDLNVVSNRGRTTPPRSVFHIDTSYLAQPPAYTALRAVAIPVEGGQTLFTNQHRAYDTLPADLRSTLAGRTIRHRASGGPDYGTFADHPAFLRHPISGRTALYLSTPERCVSVSGLPDDEATHLIAFLYRHSTSPQNTYRHSWSAGDVVMWDNRCVLHRADHAGVVGDRVMHRGMVSAGAHAH